MVVVKGSELAPLAIISCADQHNQRCGFLEAVNYWHSRKGVLSLAVARKIYEQFTFLHICDPAQKCPSFIARIQR